MKPKVLIATPSFDGNVRIEYLLSLLQTRELIDFDLCLVPGVHFVDQARDMAAARFLASDAEFLFFIDSDLEWPAQAVPRLVSYDLPVVGGAYRIKDDRHLYPNYGEQSTNDDLIKVSMLPGGFLCIRRDVIQSLWDSTPHYRTAIRGNFVEVAAMFARELHDGLMVSEDAMFSRRASAFGLWLDPDITFTHVGTKGWQGNYKEYRNADV